MRGSAVADYLTRRDFLSRIAGIVAAIASGPVLPVVLAEVVPTPAGPDVPAIWRTITGKIVYQEILKEWSCGELFTSASERNLP